MLRCWWTTLLKEMNNKYKNIFRSFLNLHNPSTLHRMLHKVRLGSGFFFSLIGCITKAKEPTIYQYLVEVEFRTSRRIEFHIVDNLSITFRTLPLRMSTPYSVDEFFKLVY